MNAVEILSGRNLKRTSCREGIIEVMMSAGRALADYEIREQLPGSYDRTTFYRSFKTLEEKSIVHKIVIDSQTVKYALDHSITHKKRHAHFFCNHCHIVVCLESVPVQAIPLPVGFSESEKEILIKGACAACNNHTDNH
jgi:Fur family ferric uptake transcriptional regulator